MAVWSQTPEVRHAVKDGGVTDQRRRPDTRTAVAGLVIGPLCLVIARATLAQGEDDPSLLVCAVGMGLLARSGSAPAIGERP
jgi:hypothetical protein